MSRELGPGRDRRQLDRSPLARGVDQGPVGEVDFALGGVVKFDELIAEADLVDLDREGVPHPLGSCLGARNAGWLARPLGHAGQEAGARSSPAK